MKTNLKNLILVAVFLCGSVFFVAQLLRAQTSDSNYEIFANNYNIFFFEKKTQRIFSYRTKDGKFSGIWQMGKQGEDLEKVKAGVDWYEN